MKFGGHKKTQKESAVYRGNSKIWAGSIIAAGVAALAVFAAMMQMEKNMLTQYEKGVMLTAVSQIPKGQLLDESNCEQYLESCEADVKLIPETAITSLEDVNGLVAGYDIDAGTFLTQGMFESVNDVIQDMEEPVIAGFKAEDMYQLVGGVLRAGDRIHIYSVRESEAGNITKLIWKNVFVQEVFDQSGIIISNEDKLTAAQRVNVYLDRDDIETFYSELAEGSLRAVKVCK